MHEEKRCSLCNENHHTGDLDDCPDCDYKDMCTECLRLHREDDCGG